MPVFAFSLERVDRVLGRLDHGLALHVERGIEQHGNAGERCELLEQAIEALVVLASDGLHAGGAVDMHDRGDLVAPLRTHALDQQHERGFFRAFENVLRALGQHDRRERPEGLPVLDPLIQFFLHLGRARVSNDAATAERPRAELGATAKPAEHMPLRQQSCRLRADVVARGKRRLQGNQPPARRSAHFGGLVLPAEIGMLHHE